MMQLLNSISIDQLCFPILPNITYIIRVGQNHVAELKSL